MDTFVALDVETANSDQSSICAIGAARYEDGLIADQWYQLVDPRDDFFWKNTEIHGIRRHHVAGQPTFADISPQLSTFVAGAPIVHHGPSDRSAIAKATDCWAASPLDSDFIDSLAMARQAWPHVGRGGYGLKNLCNLMGYELEHHHHALDDARAAGAVYLAASEQLGEQVTPAFARRIVNEESGVQLGLFQDEYRVLVGDVVVFSRESTLRSTNPGLQKELERQGCRVRDNVNDHATILVLGNEEWRRNRFSSQRKGALRRVAQGQNLVIMSETDFLAMIEER